IGRFEWRGLPVSVWLFRIASNALADHWRERARTGQEAGTGGVEAACTARCASGTQWSSLAKVVGPA
ncbi:MAG TPA: hypothetical protein VMS04_21445, partial [Vicinamibacterales bacterium]|nr:hypothetical protein [Vicinamibacterales bacterium]